MTLIRAHTAERSSFALDITKLLQTTPGIIPVWTVLLSVTTVDTDYVSALIAVCTAYIHIVLYTLYYIILPPPRPLFQILLCLHPHAPCGLRGCSN